MEPNELIVCRDASLGYEGQSVLAHLDLTIRAGDYLCIVGDNGSGKSTLMRGLLGLRQLAVEQRIGRLLTTGRRGVAAERAEDRRGLDAAHATGIGDGDALDVLDDVAGATHLE